MGKINKLILGSDSYIGQILLKNSDANSMMGISRSNAKLKNEIVISDFFDIDEQNFKGIDTVINFAAIVHRPEIKNHSIYDEVNHRLAILLANKAKHNGVKLFIQMSTIAVYGNASNIKSNSPLYPSGPYAKSKLKADENLLKLEDDNFKIAIIRPPMVYGGGNAPGNLIRLIKLVDIGIPLPFKGIDNRRDFIHVYNLIQYLNIIIEKSLNGIFLITDHEPVSTEYILNCISTDLKKKIVLFSPSKWIISLIRKIFPNEYNKMFGSLLIKTNLPIEGLIKKYTVAEGITEMVHYYKSKKY